jgi:hypothetical protein
MNPLRLLRFLRKRGGDVQKLLWRVEDLAKAGARTGFDLALKAARPVVVGEPPSSRPPQLPPALRPPASVEAAASAAASRRRGSRHDSPCRAA